MASQVCVACQEGGSEVSIELPCKQHAYCLDCLQYATQAAIKNEQCYPLRCGPDCDPIPDCLVQESLSGDILDAFCLKAEEYQVPAKDRTYCANASCLKELGHSRYLDNRIFGFQGAVICPECDSFTCCYCKTPVLQTIEHVCNEMKHDDRMKEFIQSLPEGEWWLHQKCPSCGLWTVKMDDACNHMTCHCTAEFCLICGREWDTPFQVTCGWGCPKLEAPVYDDEGYNQLGFNPDTGLDRDGESWDPAEFHAEEIGDQGDDDDDWLDQEQVFDDDGFDQWGWDEEGYDREGFGYNGYNREGYDRDGLDWSGWSAAGYDRDGLDRTGRDINLLFDDGFDMDGFDVDGISLRDLHRDFYDDEGYDPFGFDVFGFSRAGLDFEGYDPEGYSDEGFDRDGFDSSGFDVNGFNAQGYNCYGLDRNEFRRSGYTRLHRKVKDKNDPKYADIEPGYYVAPDGMVREEVDEGPSTSVMDCEHTTYNVSGSATCVFCHWTSDVFHRSCATCGVDMCRDCDNYGSVRQYREARQYYPWPGSDSYGIEDMFDRATASALLGEGRKPTH